MINIFKNPNGSFVKIKRENITPVISALSISFLIFVIALTRNNYNKSEKHNILSDQSKESFTQQSNIKYQKNRPTYVEGQVVVKYKDSELKLSRSSDRTKANQIAKSVNLEKIRSVKGMNVETYKITDSKNVEEKVKELKKDDRIEYVEPNYIYYPTYTPNDTLYQIQWALENTGQSLFVGNNGTVDADMDVNDMWDIETDHGSDIIVAVMDTGVAINNSDMQANLVPGTGFTEDGMGLVPPYDNNGHGSHVAGIIAGVVDNSRGISGISRHGNVKVMPIKISDKDGVLRLDYVLTGINYAQSNGAQIINMSFGGPIESKLFKEAIRNYPGLVVAAAGNGGFDGVGDDNDSTPEYPASYNLPNIISVAATNQHDNLATFSNYGVRSVDVGAPGEFIYSLIGQLLLTIDFDALVPPDLGDLFEVSGTHPNWGTIEYGQDNVALITDTNTIPSGTYTPESDSYITLDSFAINEPKQIYMKFFYDCDLPEPDNTLSLPKLSLEIYQGGSWKELFANNEPSVNVASVDLTKYEPLDDNINLRFRWQTGPVDLGDPGTYTGCVIDDIQIVDSGASGGAVVRMSGTSMASPYVAAVAAMVWGKNPTISPETVKRIVLETGDIVGDLPGKILTGKRVNALNAYSADPEDFNDGGDVGEGDDPIYGGRIVFHPDRRCHWKKPEPIERIQLKPAVENGVKGMQLTWVQVDADKVDIKIDDGTGKYPWKISNTENDGHEFLANVAPWQNIIIKPTNHCKKGDESVAVSLNKYPYGWHKATALAVANNNPVQSGVNASAQSKTHTQNGVLGESTQSVPDTGSEELLLIIISSILTGIGAYYIQDGRSRTLALKDFEKKSTNKL